VGAGWTGGVTVGPGAEGAGGSGVVVQAARESATTPSGTVRLRRVNDIRMAMWVLMIEACVAFFLLVFIVWWTMYQGKGKDQSKKPAAKIPPPASEQKKSLDE
jgi:plastocyanin domain-containing protein